jgi:poly(3-hydroxybutyrate) depolymerase
MGIVISALIACALGRTASAELLEKSGTFGGVALTYKVVLPDRYDPTRAYPAILVFTGGPQTLQMAGNTLEADWRKEAERRGYILISPGSPDGNLFFESADRVFPDLLDQIQRDYKITTLHIAGHSNGGLSAFHVASKYPKYFATLTGYPGLLNGRDLARKGALKPMCIFMHVGERDTGWMSAMLKQAHDLKQKGFKITITVEPNQAHRLRTQEINLSARLFDQIESCK